MNVSYMSIKWNLKIMMAVRDINNEELAAKTGLHRGTIAKLRADVPKQIHTETLTKLCEALDCEPGQLIGWEKRDQICPR